MKRYTITVYYQLHVDNTSWPMPFALTVCATSEEQAFNQALLYLYEYEKKDDNQFDTPFEDWKRGATLHRSNQNLTPGKFDWDFADEEGYVLTIVELIKL